MKKYKIGTYSQTQAKTCQENLSVNDQIYTYIFCLLLIYFIRCFVLSFCFQVSTGATRLTLLTNSRAVGKKKTVNSHPNIFSPKKMHP